MKIYVQKPRYRTILFRNPEYRSVFLPFPYVLFKIKKNIGHWDCSTCFANKLPTKKDVKIYSMPFSNFTSSFGICLGRDKFKSDYEAIARFWQSRFNSANKRTPLYDPSLENAADRLFSKWKKLSLKQILKVKWQDDETLKLHYFTDPEDMEVEYV